MKEHGKGKCYKLWHGIGGEYNHGPYDDSEYVEMDENNNTKVYCGRCHDKIREENQ